MESARCRAFLESVERGSFKAAADALGYTPSAVSQLVAALEKELSLNLLIRSKKGVTVTGEGRKLLPIVRSFLAREKEMYELASELQGLSVGNLTIAAYPSVATTWLPELVRTFQKDYPDIEECLLRNTSLEPRAVNFFIKPDKKEQFEILFNKYFGNDFDLYSKEEVIESKLFGDGKENIIFKDALADYLAIAKTNKTLLYYGSEILKSQHAGYTDDEILVPLITIKTDK